MENVFLTSLSVQEVRELLKEELSNFLPGIIAPQLDSNIEIIDGGELCKRLGITLPTLIRWKSKGKVPFMQLGSSIRYDYKKVLDALELNSKKKGVKA